MQDPSSTGSATTAPGAARADQDKAVQVNAEPSQATAKGWSPEVIESLAASLLPYFDRFLKLRESEQKHEAKITEADTKWRTKTTIALLVFAAAIIGGMSILTVLGKVSGDALLFLVGSTMGALFTRIYQQLFGQPPVIITSDDG